MSRVIPERSISELHHSVKNPVKVLRTKPGRRSTWLQLQSPKNHQHGLRLPFAFPTLDAFAFL